MSPRRRTLYAALIAFGLPILWVGLLPLIIDIVAFTIAGGALSWLIFAASVAACLFLPIRNLYIRLAITTSYGVLLLFALSVVTFEICLQFTTGCK